MDCMVFKALRWATAAWHVPSHTRYAGRRSAPAAHLQVTPTTGNIYVYRIPSYSICAHSRGRLWCQRMGRKHIACLTHQGMRQNGPPAGNSAALLRNISK